MTYSETLKGMMPSVAAELLGEPNKHLSRIGDGALRYGSHGSIEVNTREGWFADYETNTRGGVLDLVKHKAGASNDAEAFRWLEDKGIKGKDDHALAPSFYDYQDETGAVLFRVERKGTGKHKTFLQHGPDGRGGFRCAKGCMQGVRLVPYRLPELLAADTDELVFVCEGEKDADRLSGLGLVATTNPGGAGKFRADFGQYFGGRRVVVLEDNDQAGREHAADVKRKLIGVAGAVSVLRLPGLPDKGDVSDWLEAGGNIPDLKARAIGALDVADADPALRAPERKFDRGISAAALMAMQFDPIRYVVPGYIAEGLAALIQKLHLRRGVFSARRSWPSAARPLAQPGPSRPSAAPGKR